MKKKKSTILLLLLLSYSEGFSQPYVDIANFNYQRFSSHYKNDASSKNATDAYVFNMLLPKQFKNGNSLLFRINSEIIQSTRTAETTISSNLSSISIAFGYQWVSTSQKWKSTLFVLPKVASDFEKSLSKNDWQYGALFLENYKVNGRLQIKAGLYYNHEAFGNFFVPLLGVDWKATERWNFYGILPTNYKIEYNILKNKLYSGINYKAQTRSFHSTTTPTDEYVRYDEAVLKGFVDYFVFKNIVVNAEVGYSLGKNLLQYHSNSNDASNSNLIYTPLKRHPIFTIGLAYRIRKDFDKKNGRNRFISK